MTLLALVHAADYAFFAPICLAIALVTSAAHRENMRDIVRHALRSWFLLMVGMAAFGLGISFLFEWILPG